MEEMDEAQGRPMLVYRMRQEGATFKECGEAVGVGVERARGLYMKGQRIAKAEALRRQEGKYERAQDIPDDMPLGLVSREILSSRSRNCLCWNYGVPYYEVDEKLTVGHLREYFGGMTPADAMRIPNFGRTSLMEVQAFFPVGTMFRPYDVERVNHRTSPSELRKALMRIALVPLDHSKATEAEKLMKQIATEALGL